MTEPPALQTIVRFLASAAHPDDPTTVVGPGHIMLIADAAVARSFNDRGVVEIIPEGALDPQILARVQARVGW